MVITDDEYADLTTPFGSMRTHVLRPVAAGRYPGVVLFSEIFQVTGPIRRTAAMLAGHGHVVAVVGLLRRLGLDRVLSRTPSRQRDLCVGMIAGRVLGLGSKFRHLDTEIA